jgi:hypothetical protein
MVQTFTALISILGDADLAEPSRSSVAVGVTCLEGEGEGEHLISGGGCPPSCSCVRSCSCSVDLTVD